MFDPSSCLLCHPSIQKSSHWRPYILYQKGNCRFIILEDFTMTKNGTVWKPPTILLRCLARLVGIYSCCCGGVPLVFNGKIQLVFVVLLLLRVRRKLRLQLYATQRIMVLLNRFLLTPLQKCVQYTFAAGVGHFLRLYCGETTLVAF